MPNLPLVLIACKVFQDFIEHLLCGWLNRSFSWNTAFTGSPETSSRLCKSTSITSRSPDSSS
jgi:hypothetical protein